MKILISHPSYASQYKHILRGLCENPDNEVVFICRNYKQDFKAKNFKALIYDFDPNEHDDDKNGLLRSSFVHVKEGISCGKALLEYVYESNFAPDIILYHPSWGNGLFFKDLFPDTPQISYIEFYHNREFNVSCFDPFVKPYYNMLNQHKVYNNSYLHAMHDASWLICPTHWQARQIDDFFHQKLSILHDGIDLDLFDNNDPNFVLETSSGVKLTAKDEVVTYVSRGFETMRGYPTFMASIPLILKERPQAHIVVIGSDFQAYGNAPNIEKSWKTLMDKVLDFDRSRVHFMGKLEFSKYIKILSLSKAHIYLTKPFVLSWSLTEAMAAGCKIVASASPPVLEVIKHEYSGLLVDFFSAEDVAREVCRILKDPENFSYLGENAKKLIAEKFSKEKLLPLHLRLIEQVAKRQDLSEIRTEIRNIFPANQTIAALKDYMLLD